jgi:hypothetical protein
MGRAAMIAHSVIIILYARTYPPVRPRVVLGQSHLVLQHPGIWQCGALCCRAPELQVVS